METFRELRSFIFLIQKKIKYFNRSIAIGETEKETFTSVFFQILSFRYS